MKNKLHYFFKKASNFAVSHKTMVMSVLCVFIAMSSTFAGDELGVFDDVGNSLLSILTSTGLKAALALMLAGCFGGIAFGKLKGQDGIVGTLLPVGFGIAGILGAVSIITWIFGSVNESEIKFN